MGCDIHCFVEHKRKDQNRWECFVGPVNPGRNYRVFAKLAGVRVDYYDSTVYPNPKGLPKDVSWTVDRHSWLYVADNPADSRHEGFCLREHADLWVNGGLSKYNEDKSKVSNPDWHSHSWATQEELSAAIKKSSRDKYSYGVNSEWTVLNSIMKEFKRLGEDVRLVYWFDN